MNNEIGRLVLNNIILIEYDLANGSKTFFIQCGVAGFYATENELNDLFYALNYYKHIDNNENIVISVKDMEDSL